MSAQGQSLIQQQQDISFGAPAGADAEVIGVAEDTGYSNFIPNRPNVINDVTNFSDPTEIHIVSIGRDQGTRRILGTTKQMLTTFNGQTHVGYPKALNAGRFQFISRQPSAGAGLQAHRIIVTYAVPLSQ